MSECMSSTSSTNAMTGNAASHFRCSEVNRSWSLCRPPLARQLCANSESGNRARPKASPVVAHPSVVRIDQPGILQPVAQVVEVAMHVAHHCQVAGDQLRRLRLLRRPVSRHGTQPFGAQPVVMRKESLSGPREARNRAEMLVGVTT